MIKSLTIALGIFALLVAPAHATELEGTLTTGVGVSAALEGTVLGSSPTPTPTPPPAGGGGGGGGGGGLSGPLGATNNTDINRDGRVDVLDFNLLIVNWGNNPANLNADINADGRVDIFDFNLFIVTWVQ